MQSTEAVCIIYVCVIKRVLEVINNNLYNYKFQYSKVSQLVSNNIYSLKIIQLSAFNG